MLISVFLIQAGGGRRRKELTTQRRLLVEETEKSKQQKEKAKAWMHDSQHGENVKDVGKQKVSEQVITWHWREAVTTRRDSVVVDKEKERERKGAIRQEEGESEMRRYHYLLEKKSHHELSKAVADLHERNENLKKQGGEGNESEGAVEKGNEDEEEWNDDDVCRCCCCRENDDDDDSIVAEEDLALCAR